MRNMSRIRNKSDINSTTNHFSKFVDIFDERYYTINKRILCYIGQWPYQTVRERSIRSTVLLILAISLFVPQTLQLIQSWGHAASFIECFSPFVTNFGCQIKLFTFIVYTQKIKRLLDELRANWECTRHSSELKILHEHGQKGMSFTIAYLSQSITNMDERVVNNAFYFKYQYLVVFYTTIAAWTSVPLIPIVMDIVAPLNESRPHIEYYSTDYCVDQDKYFYPIFLHSFAVTAVGLPIFVAVDTFFMMISQHACAMLNILRYRLENMTEMDNEVIVRFDTDVREDFYYQQIVACIMQHKDAIEYIRVIQGTCQSYLLLLVGLNMLSISCTCSQIVAKGTSTQDVLRFTFFTVAQVLHLFCNSLPGHWIRETSSLLPISAYSCNWYVMPPRSRELIVIFIRRSIEPCLITAGKIYVMSLENFRCVLQSSISYMTLLTSMQ